MSDNEQTEPTAAPERHAFIRLYHRTAPVQVSIPIPLTAGLQPADCERLMLSVDNLLAAGWLPNLAGVEAGEDVEEVGAVLRRTVDSRSHPSGECPRLALYSPNPAMKWKFLDVYLNTEDEIAVFEKVSGLRVSAITNFDGTSAPARGDKRTDKFIHNAPRPFKVVLKNNPHYDEDKATAAKAANEVYKVPKTLFVRWLDAPAVDKTPPTQTYAESQQTDRPLPIAEQRKAKIMVMQWGELAKARDYADTLPVHEGQPFSLAVRDRAFELFKYDAANADANALKDIEDAVNGKLYGIPTNEQKRDLDAVIKMRRAALGAKK